MNRSCILILGITGFVVNASVASAQSTQPGVRFQPPTEVQTVALQQTAPPAMAMLASMPPTLGTTQPRAEEIPPGQSAPAPISLTDLENIALANNPTLSEAAARIRAQQGNWTQQGLYPNPRLIYKGTKWVTRIPPAFRAFL